MKWLARLMLGLMLFTQGVVAANACTAPEVSATHAYSMAADEGMGSCHEHETQSSNANACLAHCTQSDQISADQHVAPLAAPVSVAVRVSPQPVVPASFPKARFEQVALDTGPSLPIRFCSLLN